MTTTEAMTMEMTTIPAPRNQERQWSDVLLTPVTVPALKSYVYFAAITALAVVGVTYIFSVGLGSALMIFTLIGIPLVALVVFSGRGWSWIYRRLAHFVGVEIPAPRPFGPASGLWMTLGRALTDLTGWRALAFVTVQAGALTLVGYGVLMLAFVSGVLSLSLPIWLIGGEPVVNFDSDHGVDSFWGNAFVSLGGLVALYLTLWIILGLSKVHTLFATLMLRPAVSDERVVELERSRSAVVEDAAATLQRVERDLHDGTQARLVAVAMTLSRAEQRLTPDSVDIPGARKLVGDALTNAKDALTELRDVVRGIRPPALDLGLDAAVTTLAARSVVPIDLTSNIVVRPSLGVETLAYFCIAELLTNIARHSGATRGSVRVDSDAAMLRIMVGDNGHGGAVIGGGSGLAGLRDRVGTVDGVLRVYSPKGGPTSVTIEIPTGKAR